MTTPAAATRYIVQTARARMPASCWGNYGRVAVLEIDRAASDIAMISARAIGCVRVVRTWERCNIGSTDRSAFAVAVLEAEAIAAELNAL